MRYFTSISVKNIEQHTRPLTQMSTDNQLRKHTCTLTVFASNDERFSLAM